MKKFLLSLAALLCVLVASATVKTFTVSEMTWAGGTTQYKAEQDGFTFVLDKSASPTNLVAPAAHMRVYQGATFTITAPEGAVMTKVIMTDVHSAATAVSQMTFLTGWTAFGTLSSSTKAEEFGATSDGLNSLKMDAGKQVRITAIEIEYTANGPVKDDAELSFPASAYDVRMGQTFTAPTLSKMTDAAPVYSSSNTDVATVDAATGQVTLVAEGTTVITANCAATDDFYAGVASYTLTVLSENTVFAWDWKATKAQVFTFVGQTENYPWSYDSTYGLKGSAYVSGAQQATDVVAASPVIDLSKDKAPIKVTVHNALNQYKLNNELIDVAEVGDYATFVVREEGATEWTKVAAPAPTSFSWAYFDDTFMLDAYAGKKIQIGFRYVSSTSIAGTWEIDKLTVESDGIDAVETIAADNNADAPVMYYNLQGVRVENPANGLYIRVQGSKATKVLVK